MTGPFFPIVDPVVDSQFNWDRLSSLLLDTGGRRLKLRVGSATVTWPGGGPVSTAKAVAHGMGSAPAHVYLTMTFPINVNSVFRENSAADATNINVVGVCSDLVTAIGAGTTQNFHWLAIG